MKFLFTHNPIVSDKVIKLLCYNLNEKKDNVDEAAVFELANGKFAYIRYSGVKSKPDKGVTDIEEFDTFEEAEKLFIDYT